MVSCMLVLYCCHFGLLLGGILLVILIIVLCTAPSCYSSCLVIGRVTSQELGCLEFFSKIKKKEKKFFYSLICFAYF